mgnify:CR=1 FL=1
MAGSCVPGSASPPLSVCSAGNSDPKSDRDPKSELISDPWTSDVEKLPQATDEPAWCVIGDEDWMRKMGFERRRRRRRAAMRWKQGGALGTKGWRDGVGMWDGVGMRDVGWGWDVGCGMGLG